MKLVHSWGLAALLAVAALGPVASSAAAPAAPPHNKPHNWVAPDYRIYAQQLADEVMRDNPELLSITLQGTPPGQDKTYTMFAGSFPERIGQASDPDDIMVIDTAITILDPRWNRNDPVRKFIVMMPLEDAQATPVGLAVIVFKNPVGINKSNGEYLAKAQSIMDKLRTRIPDKAALFAPAK
jgi:ABC-type glycerol-3-phosphate transport system substrate-binding protein